MDILLCDSDGVPLLVQSIRYNYSGMWFVVVFFNGKDRVFTVDEVCPNVGITCRRPDKMQMMQVENTVNKLAKNEWSKWFTSATVHRI